MSHVVTSRLLLLLGASATSLVCAWPAAAADSDPALTGANPPPDAVWVESLDLSAMSSHFGRPTAGRSVTGNPLRIGGTTFVHGIGTHADSELTVDLGGNAVRFVADVGVDDELKCLESMNATKLAATRFLVFADGKQIADSGPLRFGDAPKRISADLTGKKQLRLVAKREKDARFNHVDWGGAAIVLKPGAAATALKTVAPKEPIKLPHRPQGEPLSPADEALVRGTKLPANGVWLDSLEIGNARTPNKPAAAGKTPEGKPLQLGSVTYPHGVGLFGEAFLRVELGGAASRFVANVGIDGGLSCSKALSGGGGTFQVWVDGKRVVDTGTMHGWDAPIGVSVDLTGAKLMLLTTTGDASVFDWAGAVFVMAKPGAKPRIVPFPPPAPASIAKTRPDELGIHGARVVGTTPGRPFVFLIPATGKPPLTFSATGLPAGLTLDAATGVVSGTVKKAGRSVATITLKDAGGAQVTRTLTVEAGANKLAMTPPMGWNSWNVWGLDVTQDKVRAAADSLLKSGLAAHGFLYVNIDDAWEAGRDAKGEVLPNEKFPDMKGLSDYVHGKGLRLGIYTSPGPKTCGGFEGSYKHEAQDAKTYGKWGIDYVKHDWCSYGSIAKGSALPELQKPYKIMSKALAASGRDIVYSLCQYGMGDVWKWGASVGGNLWRTTGDITDTWGSLSDIGFSQADKAPYAGPGHWNDPDMLIVGKVGWSASIRNTRLTPNEQVTHLTLWSMLAAPLLIGCDLTQLDAFTIDLLTNDDVLDVDQDPLGKQAERKRQDAGGTELWVRPLSDGTTAVAVFNRGEEPAKAQVTWAELGLSGEQPVRDLWLRKDAGKFKDGYTATVPVHGAVMLKIGTPKPQ